MTSALSRYEESIDALVTKYQNAPKGITDFNDVHMELMKQVEAPAYTDKAMDFKLLHKFRYEQQALRSAQAAFRLDMQLAQACKKQRLGVGADGLQTGVAKDPSPAQALVENVTCVTARKRQRELSARQEPFRPLMETAGSRRAAAASSLLNQAGECHFDDADTVHFITRMTFEHELLRRLENNVCDVLSLYP